jgi:hypothetical protein
LFGGPEQKFQHFEQQNKMSFMAACAITPTSKKTPNPPQHISTTVGSKKLQAKRLHFSTCLLTQDLVALAETITEAFKGDDKRAQEKAKKATEELLKGLKVVQQRQNEFNMLSGFRNDCAVYISKVQKETNASIKR